MPEIAGRDVLLLDDLFRHRADSFAGAQPPAQFQPASLRSAVLLWKEGRRRRFRPTIIASGFPTSSSSDTGLDYNDEFRHLPYVAALAESDL